MRSYGLAGAPCQKTLGFHGPRGAHCAAAGVAKMVAATIVETSFFIRPLLRWRERGTDTIGPRLQSYAIFTLPSGAPRAACPTRRENRGRRERPVPRPA